MEIKSQKAIKAVTKYPTIPSMDILKILGPILYIKIIEELNTKADIIIANTSLLIILFSSLRVLSSPLNLS